MWIKILNGTWSKNLLVLHTLEFCAAKLCLPYRKRVRVTVEFVQGLKKHFKCVGRAYQVAPKTYLIEIERGLKTVALLQCLTHELVHVNQWMTGKMQDIEDRHKVKWGNRVFASGLAYSKHPWERQAYRIGKALARELMKAATRGN